MCVCVCVCAFGHGYLNSRCLDFLNVSVPIGWNKRKKNVNQTNKQNVASHLQLVIQLCS